jgi:hypothetical protein
MTQLRYCLLRSDVIVPLAAAHGVALYPSIRRALLHGTDSLNVDGVLVIGEKVLRGNQMFQTSICPVIHCSQMDHSLILAHALPC